MNFLLTWIHWGLAALLYFHNAKLSQAAPTQKDAKHHNDVIPFLEVFNRSACRAIETMVDILQEYPDQVEYIFKPSCVPLMKCAGCCNDEALECVPTETGNITMQIMRIKHFQGQHMSQMSFQEHHKCECRPKKAKQEEKSKRGKGKGQKRKRKRGRYKPQTFHCEPCSERRKHLFVQDPQTCKCSCKYTDARCKLRQLELNERTCRCYAPRR